MEKLLCPSMMCANFASLKKEIKDLREGRKIIRNSFEIKEYKPVMEGGL